jgi:membrane-associated phospholipid phosphatase
MKSRVVLIAFVFLSLLALSARAHQPARVSPVFTEQASSRAGLAERVTLEWYKLTLELVRHTATYSPPVASRAFGYLGVVLFEATAAGSGKLRSLEGQLNGLRGLPRLEVGAQYDAAVIVHGALSSAMAALFGNTGPTGQRALEFVRKRLEAEVSSGIAGDVAQRSLEFGRRVSASVLAWAEGDGGSSIENLGFPLTYPKASSPSAWVPTAALGLQQTPLLPTWGDNRPLAMKTGNDCPLPAPLEYSADKNSPFYKEALEVYTVSRNLTQEQRSIAQFWSDDPMLSPTPPGHWVGIFLQIAQDKRFDLETLAEGLARVGIAVADAFVGCWHTKYQFNLLRPVTYIRRVIDPQWSSFMTTPPFPEYPSGHSTQSGAAATVLTAFLGENFAFEDRTHEDDGLEPRAFKSFWDAANEAGISRLYGGIHYRTAIERGLEQGRCVGEKVNRLQFKR